LPEGQNCRIFGGEERRIVGFGENPADILDVRVFVQRIDPMDRTREEVASLYEVSLVLGTSPNLEEALQSVLSLLAERADMQRGTITLLAEEGDEVAIELAHGLSPEEMERGRYRVGEGITGKVVETGEPVVVPRIDQEPLFLDRTGARSGLDQSHISFICVPIKLRGETIGTLSADKATDGGQGGADAESLRRDVRVLSVVAAMIAQSVASRRRARQEQEYLRRENVRLRDELRERRGPENIVGTSRPMQAVYELIYQVAASNVAVLIRGETGTGKELVADAIHFASPRAGGPLVKVHCAALPETLLESELFGHEKGAFTGAVESKAGRFELANGGTVFLDEVGELSPTVQAKLLRVLQSKTFERIGGTETVSVDVRILAASNADLETAVADGRFRQDLLFRLNVFPIFLPPLRDRKSDLMLLANHFLGEYSQQLGKPARRITTPAIDLMMAYHWPGNVRELENVIQRAMLLSDDGVIRAHHLPPSLQTASSTGTELSGSFTALVVAYERELIVEALKAARGIKAKAARLLGITPRILSYQARKLGIDAAQFRP
jgi:Nif-specific regulatory protein